MQIVAEKVLLIVDEDAEIVQEAWDDKRGELVESTEKAGAFAKRHKLNYVPMKDSLRKRVLYEKKGAVKGRNAARKTVTLGDLGPFVIVKLKDGDIANDWGYHGLAKPMSVTPNTLLGLKGLFVSDATA